MRDEDNARSWIAGRPEAYCNTSDPDILGRVLNNYDRETADFYRWEVNYRKMNLQLLYIAVRVSILAASCRSSRSAAVVQDA